MVVFIYYYVGANSGKPSNYLYWVQIKYMIDAKNRVKHLVSQAETPEEAEQIIDDYEATEQEPEQD